MQIEQRSLPTGALRVFMRFPIWLYRLKLGGLLGGRFLCLHHIGRVSGQVRKAVVEVMRYDQVSDAYMIVSGYGRRSQWYQNLKKSPAVDIEVGRKKLRVMADFLSVQQGEAELRGYAERYPKAWAALAKSMGYMNGGKLADFSEISEYLPVIALRPA